MTNDPFTLIIALDDKGQAEGDLYLDDGHSFAYLGGQYLHRRCVAGLGLVVSNICWAVLTRKDQVLDVGISWHAFVWLLAALADALVCALSHGSCRGSGNAADPACAVQNAIQHMLFSSTFLLPYPQ